MIGLIITTLVILVLLFVLLKRVKWLSDFIKNSKPQIELLYVIASIATIVALFSAIGIYHKERKIQEENEGIILEILKTEISLNLGFIESFQERKEIYMSTDLWTNARFDYDYLEKSLELIEDKATRTAIMFSIKNMKGSNKALEDFSNVLVGLNKEESDTYMKLKNDAINTIEKLNSDIKTLLKGINESIN